MHLRIATAFLGAFVGLMLSAISAHAAPTCNVTMETESDRLSPRRVSATAIPDGVELNWSGSSSSDVTLRVDITGAAPRISLLSIDSVPILQDAEIRFDVTTGVRRITNQQLAPLRALGVALTQDVVDEHKWDAFWDAPLETGARAPASGLSSNQPPTDGIADQPGLPRSPEEVERSSVRYAISACEASLGNSRVVLRLDGATAGAFGGRLEISAYAHTNLIRVAFVAKTDRPSVAFKYDAGIEAMSITPDAAVRWLDTAGEVQSARLDGSPNDDPVAIADRNRIIVAETGAVGAIAVMPPPHTFFWAREIETNVGNNWYRRHPGGRFGLGVRQADREIREEFRANWALYSAPPGSEQRMAFYLFPSASSAESAREGALSFTRGDRYEPLPGYKVMGHHYHLGMGERLVASGSLDTRLRDFEALRSAGIDIVSVTDIFPDQRNPGGPKRLEVLRAYYEGAARSSDKDFLVMPSVEATAILGGHWDVLMPEPVLWLENRADGEAFRTREDDGTTVYRLRDEDDAIRMIRETGMLVFMPHPRTKGSTHYPDAISDSEAFNADFYRGVGWRWGMGADLSERRLSDKRVLPLFDTMNDWMAARNQRPKYLLAITETFDKQPGDDIYANNPVNYVKLDRLPQGTDHSAVIDALAEGEYFVTSGEILVPFTEIRTHAGSSKFVADLQWTFPLDFVELVWGDGRETQRTIVDAHSFPPFGSQRFEIDFPESEAKWVRFAAWDSAGNGAMTQPVSVSPDGNSTAP